MMDGFNLADGCPLRALNSPSSSRREERGVASVVLRRGRLAWRLWGGLPALACTPTNCGTTGRAVDADRTAAIVARLLAATSTTKESPPAGSAASERCARCEAGTLGALPSPRTRSGAVTVIFAACCRASTYRVTLSASANASCRPRRPDCRLASAASTLARARAELVRGSAASAYADGAATASRDGADATPYGRDTPIAGLYTTPSR